MSHLDIGIRFPDNDFGNTVRGFLRNLMWSHINATDLTAEELTELFNETADAVYRLCQDFDGPSAGAYIRIKLTDVFLGEAAGTKGRELTATGQANGDYHVLCWPGGSDPYIYTV